jgi:hypothetical protein
VITTTGMTHIALQENLDGKVGNGMEQVTDEQYQSRSGAESKEVGYAVR